MGAWGVEPFDNDDAADWAAEFDGVDRSVGLALLRDALAAVDGTEYLEAPEGAVAVAAAQAVAWLLHPAVLPGSPYSEPVIGWLLTNALSVDPGLVDAARRALGRVRSPDSELAELWVDPDDAEWERVLDRIDSQLRSDR